MAASEYLSPRELGRAVGLSESSVRRWADGGRLQVERTAGGHRRIARAEAVRFVREAGLALRRPDLLGFTRERPEPEIGSVPTADSLIDALRAPDVRAARRMLVSAFLDGAPLAALCDGPIRGALREIGLLWREGPEGIVHERRAVEACLLALVEILSAIPERPGAPLAFGGAVEADPYVLPTVMTTVVLADLGFRSFNLGVGVPTAAMLAAIDLYAPALVWRSASGPGAAATLRREARHLARTAPASRPIFVVGGRGVTPGDLPRVGVQHLHSMAELAGFGRALLARQS